MAEGELPSVFLEDLSTRHVQRALAAGFDTAIVVLGAQEQHGPHLPLSTDSLWGREIGGRVARALGNALVTPTLAVGVSVEHLSFPGSMSISQATFTAILGDYVRSLEQSGFHWIFLLPSHGGNVEPLRVALPEIERAVNRARILAYTNLFELVAVGAQVAARHGISADIAGAHAGEWETSMILALRPGLVATDHLEAGYLGDLEPVFSQIMREGMEAVTANGILGDARPATAAHGENYLSALSEFFTDWVRRVRDA